MACRKAPRRPPLISASFPRILDSAGTRTPSSPAIDPPLLNNEVCMRPILLSTFALSLALLLCGCLQVQPQPAVPPTTMTSWGPLGGFAVSSGTTCAGHLLLSGRTAVTSDQCL